MDLEMEAAYICPLSCGWLWASSEQYSPAFPFSEYLAPHKCVWCTIWMHSNLYFTVKCIVKMMYYIHSAVHQGFDSKCHSPIIRDLIKREVWLEVAHHHRNEKLPTESEIIRIILSWNPENSVFLRSVYIYRYLSITYLFHVCRKM